MLVHRRKLSGNIPLEFGFHSECLGWPPSHCVRNFETHWRCVIFIFRWQDRRNGHRGLRDQWSPFLMVLAHLHTRWLRYMAYSEINVLMSFEMTYSVTWIYFSSQLVLIQEKRIAGLRTGGWSGQNMMTKINSKTYTWRWYTHQYHPSEYSTWWPRTGQCSSRAWASHGPFWCFPILTLAAWNRRLRMIELVLTQMTLSSRTYEGPVTVMRARVGTWIK